MALACVRAARLTDLPFLLARAAEQGVTAARGDAMVNNNESKRHKPEAWPEATSFDVRCPEGGEC